MAAIRQIMISKTERIDMPATNPTSPPISARNCSNGYAGISVICITSNGLYENVMTLRYTPTWLIYAGVHEMPRNLYTIEK